MPYRNKLECLSHVSHFHPYLIFVDKAGAHQSGALPKVIPSKALKYIRLMWTDSGKHSSLSRYGKNYYCKSFSTGPGLIQTVFLSVCEEQVFCFSGTPNKFFKVFRKLFWGIVLRFTFVENYFFFHCFSGTKFGLVQFSYNSLNYNKQN